MSLYINKTVFGFFIVGIVISAQAQTVTQTGSVKVEKKQKSDTDPSKPDVTVKGEETGGDVYNFYFQKAESAPGVVKQSDNPDIPGPLSTTPNVAPEENKNQNVGKQNLWDLSFGLAEFRETEKPTKSFLFEARYNLNKYVGVKGFLTSAYAQAGDSQRSGFSSLDLGMFTNITPLHINLFGFTFLELGFDLGLMTFQSAVLNSYDSVQNKYMNYEKQLLPTFGVSWAINFSDKVSLAVNTRRSSSIDNKVGQGLYSDAAIRIRY